MGVGAGNAGKRGKRGFGADLARIWGIVQTREMGMLIIIPSGKEGIIGLRSLAHWGRLATRERAFIINSIHARAPEGAPAVF